MATQSDTTSHSEGYTVYVRDEVFHLSHSQISFDSPNYFTICFDSGFSESRNRTLRLDRHPALFAIVVDYLSGYPVLPLSTRAIPATMDMQTALRFLLADSQFYELQGLCDLLTLPPCTMDLSWMGLAGTFVSLCDVLNDTLPEGIVKNDDGSVVSAHSKLPVLISARDMVIKIRTSAKVDARPRGFYASPPDPEASYSIELSYPDIPATMCTPLPNSSPPHAPSEHQAILSMSTVHADGSISVDGHHYSLSNVNHYCSRTPYGLNKLEPFIQGQQQIWTTPHASDTQFQWEHRLQTFWADEVITCLVPRATAGPESGQATTATLISAKMRSCPEILAGLRRQTAI